MRIGMAGFIALLCVLVSMSSMAADAVSAMPAVIDTAPLRPAFAPDAPASDSASAAAATTAEQSFVADVKVAHIPETMQFALPGSVHNLSGGASHYWYPAYWLFVQQCAADQSSCVRIELRENCAVTNCLSGTARTMAPEDALLCDVISYNSVSAAYWPCKLTINEDRDTFHIVGSAIAPFSSQTPTAYTRYVAAPGVELPVSGGTGVCYWLRGDNADLTGSNDNSQFDGTSAAGSVVSSNTTPCNATPPAGSADMDAASDILEAHVTLANQPASPIVLDQHGITGTWYDPETSGQGFLLEEFPSLHQLFVGWYTYDTAGGSDHDQRWYVLSGGVAYGASQIDLSILAGYSGNFAAPPAAGVTEVGLATLRFSSCTSGTLDYFFYDGRQGQIPLSRFFGNIGCTASGTGATEPRQSLLSGNWYNRASSGQGFEFEFNTPQQQMFGTWYTFGAAAASNSAPTTQRWYSLQLSGFDADQTDFPGVPMFSNSGGTFGEHGGVTTTPVGTVDLSFHSCSSATAVYHFTAGENAGKSASIDLVRVGPTPAGCTP